MKNADRPAFVNHTMTGGQLSVDTTKTGLTKREYFAGLAMRGILAGNDYKEEQIETQALICKISIQMADELLKQLNG